ncbi:MAG: efflux RND transporter periplasmic adaptor subunit [Anaerotignaceae bacterium]
MYYKKTIILLAIILTLALSGCTAAEATEEEQQAPAVMAIEVLPAKMGEVETNYIYAGKTAPVETVAVFSTLSGIVNKANYNIGDKVKAGDILFEMDTESIQTSLKQLRASYDAAIANIEVNQITLESIRSDELDLQIENQRIAMENAETAYNNTKALYEQGFVSQVDMDNVENQYNMAKQSYEVTKSQTTIEDSIKKAEAGLNASQASANATAAQIEGVEKNLRDAVVRSPISGVITGKNVTAGVLLTNSAAPYTIADLSSVIVNVSVSEQLINSVQKGTQVNVKIAAASDETIEGTVKTINPVANAQGTYDLEIQINNADGVIKSGMFAEVSFNKEKGHNSIVVDRDAVITKNNETYVFVAENGVAVQKNILMGIDDGVSVQILSGIEENDNVIVKGQTYLKDGDLVNIVNADANTEENTNENADENADGNETDSSETKGE